MTLSDTQRRILADAAQHPEHLAYPPLRLPAGARQKVAQALLRQALVLGVQRPGYDAQAQWLVEGQAMLLRLTDEGLRAVADGAAVQNTHVATDVRPRHEQNGVDEALIYGPATDWGRQPTARRHRLREAAEVLLAAWEAREPLDEAMEALRAALAKPVRVTGAPRKPYKRREGTKQDTVLALLRRPEGTTVAQIGEATGWLPHTVRGFFALLKKKGFDIQVLDRVRMVGPDKQGAKGSYTVYAIRD